MVKIMENHIKMDDFGVLPLFFGKHRYDLYVYSSGFWNDPTEKNPIQASKLCVICPEYIMAVVIDIHSLS